MIGPRRWRTGGAAGAGSERARRDRGGEEKKGSQEDFKPELEVEKCFPSAPLMVVGRAAGLEWPETLGSPSVSEIRKTDLDVMTLQCEASHVFNASAWDLLCMYPHCVCVVFLRVSVFIPQSKNIHMGRTGTSELTVGAPVRGKVGFVYVSLCGPASWERLRRTLVTPNVRGRMAG